jgi:hypothetical protein
MPKSSESLGGKCQGDPLPPWAPSLARSPRWGAARARERRAAAGGGAGAVLVGLQPLAERRGSGS